MNDAAVARWLEALHARHVAPYRSQEFTKALRALSVRYVERRSELADRSPLDSAGKRAAFAAFYAPLHFLTIREIVGALPAEARAATSIVDLGCGTGVGAAAWQSAQPDQRLSIAGVDMNAWALEEAKWNWQTLGVSGRAMRGDLVAATPSATGRGRPDTVLLAWAVNEIPLAPRDQLLAQLQHFVAGGGRALVIEPLSKAASPWWQHWIKTLAPATVQADEWKFRVALPPILTELSKRAGFQRDSLGARSLWITPPPQA